MSVSQAPAQRLFSLDALRGFDMFWIMGAEGIFHTLGKIHPNSFWKTLSNQFLHPDWHGFAAYDLIFPLFLFLAGVAVPFSIGKQLEQGKTQQQVLIKVIRRGFILVLLGIIYNNGLEIRPLSEIRFGSVLGRIGLAYMFATILYIYVSKRALYITFTAILILYWVLFLTTSAPGYPAGDLSMEGNIVSYLDRLLMPGKLYLGIHDPEGWVSTFPAIATALLGIFAGIKLKNTTLETQQKTVITFVIVGVVCLIVAQLWNLVFPINKNIWTSSFVLQCGGLSYLLLALFYYLIDVLDNKKAGFFFKVIGVNSILIYMAPLFIDFEYTASFFLEWLYQLVGDPYKAVVVVLGFLAAQWAFLYICYRNKIFLKV